MDADFQQGFVDRPGWDQVVGSGRGSPSGRAPKPPRILIVGNGPSVVQRAWGREIDKFEEVIRFNLFRLKGFTDKTGTKTTIWSKNTSVPDGDLPVGATLIRISPLGGGQRYRSCGICTIERNVPGLAWPSSGLCVINHFIKSGVYPVVIGIDAYSSDFPRNYWSEEHAKPEDPHSAREEEEWLVAMHEAGKITMLEELLNDSH